MLSRVPREGAWRDTLAAPLGLLQNKHWTLFLLYASFNKSENRFSFRFSSVPQSCLILCDHMDCSTPGFPVHHQLRSLLKLMSIESVMPSNHLNLCRPLLLLSIFPSIRIFSDEPVLRIRWPKYWSFSFSISPFNEYSGLISFRMDWLDLLAVQGILKSLLYTTVQKHQLFGAQLSLYIVQLSTSIHDYWKKHSFD